MRQSRQKRRKSAQVEAPSQTALPVSADSGWFARYGAWIAVAAIVLAVIAIRLSNAGFALERDEGEYGYAGQLILQGVPPYQAAFNMKFPGTYYAYAIVLALFGQTAAGIRAGLSVVNAASIVLLFAIARRFLRDRSAVVAAAVFAAMSLAPKMLALSAHATHFVLLPLLAALWVSLNRRPAYLPALGAGVFIGVAALMKQHAVVFVPLLAALAFWTSEDDESTSLATRAGRAALVLAGATIPIVAVAAVLTLQGAFSAFWFWTIDYARAYVSEVSIGDAPAVFAQTWPRVSESLLPIWTGAGVGLILLWTTRWPRHLRCWLTAFAITSVLAICPGFYFREHYFILLLPAVGVLVGVVAAVVDRWVEARISAWGAALVQVAFAAVVILPFAAGQGAMLFGTASTELSRAIYATDMFNDAETVGRQIRDNSSPDARIAVLGSEPEIYFYAGRRSATGYIYTYALMEPQPYASRMQDEMIRQVEDTHPEYVVAVLDQTSWLMRPSSDRKIVDWVSRYTDACYQRVAVAIPAESPLWLFKRKSHSPCRAGG